VKTITLCGGPLDGMRVPAPRKPWPIRIALEDPAGVWFDRPKMGGDVNLIEGRRRDPRGTWVGYAHHVYLRTSEPGTTQFRYESSRQVLRCTRVVGSRYCLNPADEGSNECTTHLRQVQEAELKGTLSKAEILDICTHIADRIGSGIHVDWDSVRLARKLEVGIRRGFDGDDVIRERVKCVKALVGDWFSDPRFPSWAAEKPKQLQRELYQALENLRDAVERIYAE
jgi:hypothetical protein